MILTDDMWKPVEDDLKSLDDLFKEIKNHEDMLDGNLARIHLAKDVEEIETMKKYAHWRIDEVARIMTEILRRMKND